MCTLCYGDGRVRQETTSPRSSEWAQKMEYVVEQMMASILQLQTQMIDLETTLQQKPKNSDQNVREEATPSQGSSSGSADRRPAEGREPA